LKSGGYVAIDQTEALTAIDVNTGRYVGERDPETTALETNLEAVKVVAEQLRLRNIGGLIIIDFIDMQRAGHRRMVSEAVSAALKKDKARTTVLSISPLGLMEMTRRRTRESLPEILCAPCPHCDGTGRIKAAATVAYEILRRIKSEAARNPAVARFTVTTDPAVARFLADAERRGLEQLERETGKQIEIQASQNLPNARAFELVAQMPGTKTN
jgi:ribonuclease G